MTQPSLYTTFDTSLIDLSAEPAQSTRDATLFHDSFPTVTDPTPSGDGKEPRPKLSGEVTTQVPAALSISSPIFKQASTTNRKMPTRYVPTVNAYDTWAEVYDCDGNILQAVDDLELGSMIPELLKLTCENIQPTVPRTLHIVDLGCGTGRNTLRLLKAQWPEEVTLSVLGIDASMGMLAKAEEKIASHLSTLPLDLRTRRYCRFIRHDFLDPADANLRPIPLVIPDGHVDGVPVQFDALLTTLVLEHFPLATFFQVLRSLVKPNGIALLTNMHSEMGSQSQAGFVSKDEQGNPIKVRGTSWAHSVKETADAAVAAGFEISGEVKETQVSREMIRNGIVGERGEKWIGVHVWYGMLLKKTV